MNKRRGWGEGSVHFAPARNEWVGMASLGVGPDGKRRRLAVYAPSKKLALQKLADLRARTGARAPDKRQTLREFAEAWLEGTVKVKRRATTFRSYAGITRNHIVPTIGNVRVDRLELADVDRCLGAVLERSGVSMAAKARTVLNLIMRRAVREKAALHNPVTAHESDTVPKRQMSFLTSEQLTKLFEAAAGDRFEALPILLATSGLRIGEARALTWGDVDLDARVIRITKTAQEASGAIVIVPPKTDAGRRNVALTPATVKALRKRKSRCRRRRLRDGKRSRFPFDHRNDYSA
jgi:integrase